MAMFKNDKVDTYTTVDTAPDRYRTLTGTISSNGIFVTGVGTLFTTEIGGGDALPPMTPTLVMQNRSWLFNGTTELRRISAVVDDTHLVLEEGFTVNLAGAAPLFVRASRAITVSVLADGTGLTVDGQAIADGTSITFGYAAHSAGFVVNPLIIGGGAASGIVTIFWQN